MGSGRDSLPEIDGRSLWARRMRELIGLHISDLRGAQAVHQPERGGVQNKPHLIGRRAGVDHPKYHQPLYARL
jgi:hypothetical protein